MWILFLLHFAGMALALFPMAHHSSAARLAAQLAGGAPPLDPLSVLDCSDVWFALFGTFLLVACLVAGAYMMHLKEQQEAPPANKG